MTEDYREIKLYSSKEEREMYDNMADLFSIVQTLDLLEKAYVKDSVTAEEYTPACERLIAQYKTCKNLLLHEVTDLESFMKKYSFSCPAAYNRLKIGVPATIEHGGLTEVEGKKVSQYVAEVVQYFITLMDSVKLNMVAIDEIHPQLNDLLQSMNKIKSLQEDSENFDFKSKIRQWLEITNTMKASDELNEEQKRQLLFDLEQAHNAFYRALAK